MTFDIATTVQKWRAAPHISARSVLVTILGDVVLPVAQSVWLTQLFKLTEPFGFNSRLVRTSLFRLADEGWVTPERHGRRSQYLLTPFAEREFVDAASRIYQNDRLALDARWTLLLCDTAQLANREPERLARHLGWHGFVTLERGVLVSPICGVEASRTIVAEAFPQVRLAVAEVEFVNIADLLREGFFASAFAFDEIEKAYRAFVDIYAEFANQAEQLSSLAAYCARTMLIHDLRRITLRMPPIPAELLPTPWSGDEAYALAARLYSQLCETSAPVLGDFLELKYPTLLVDRFVDAKSGSNDDTDRS